MQQEVHVGDVGTEYRVPCYDDDLTPAAFDPSGASSKKLYFTMPGNDATISRDATVETGTLNGETAYFLTYEVLPADVVVGAGSGSFHTEPGPVTIQGRVEYADGRVWRSNKITTDQQGRALKVYPNL